MTLVAFALIGLFVATCAVDDQSDADGTTGDLTWSVNSSGTELTISVTSGEGTASMPDYDTMDDVPWKSYKTTATLVVINSGVTSIGKNAFRGFTSLTSVSMVNVTAIGDYAFVGCTKLNSITLTDITSVGSYAFHNCSALTKANLVSATIIKNDAFKNCGSLSYVKLTAVTTIQDNAFEGCNAISYLEIGSSLANLGQMDTFGAISFYTGTTQESVTATVLKGKVWMGPGDKTAKVLYNSSASGEKIITFDDNGGAASSEKMVTVNGKLPYLPTAKKGTQDLLYWVIQDTTTRVDTSYTFDSAKTLVANYGNAVPVTSVSLNETSKQLIRGETFQLTATVLPANATDKSVVFTSDNEDVEVDPETGMVTTFNTGTAIITVTTNDGAKTATCTITVIDTPITGITLDKTEAVIGLNGSLTLHATVLPADATDKTVNWTSSNPNVATVSSMGIVTAKAAGNTTITATTAVSGKTATCSVIVATKLVESITVTPRTANLDVGGTLTLEATITPADATVKTIRWSSDDTTKATVNDRGVVTGLAAGTVNITATTLDGNKTSSCTVTLASVPLTGLTVEPVSAEIAVNRTLELQVTFIPANASNKTINWTSSDSTVASVSKDGVVTGLKAGEVTITGTSAADSTKKVTCAVKVITVAVEKVEITPIDPIEVDDLVTMTAVITPDTASDLTVKWTSSNPGVASIDEDTGDVIGITPGTTTITATSNSDSTKSAKFTLTVNDIQTIEADYISVGNKAVIMDDEDVNFYIDQVVLEKLKPRVLIDAKAERSVNTAVIPMTVVKKLAGINGASLLFVDYEGSLEIPAAGLSKLDDTKEDVEISIYPILATDAQKNMGIVKVLTVDIIYDDTTIETNFGSKAKFSMRYTLEDGEKVENMRVAYLPSEGNPVVIRGATYDEGIVYFESDHASDYGIAFTILPGENDNTMTIIIIAIVVVAIGIAMFYLYRYTDTFKNLQNRGKGGNIPPKDKDGSKVIRPVRKP